MKVIGSNPQKNPHLGLSYLGGFNEFNKIEKEQLPRKDHCSLEKEQPPFKVKLLLNAKVFCQRLLHFKYKEKKLFKKYKLCRVIHKKAHLLQWTLMNLTNQNEKTILKADQTII